MVCCIFFVQAEDGIRYLVRSRGLGDVYKRQFWDRVVDVNLMGPIKLTRALLGPMIERRSGKIVNLSLIHI